MAYTGNNLHEQFRIIQFDSVQKDVTPGYGSCHSKILSFCRLSLLSSKRHV
jgi:hypothetical protein